MPAFPDITVTPDTDYKGLLDKLQRFFKAAMPFWKDVAALTAAAGLDHGVLNGLGDDDHTHYLNTARHTAIAGDHVTNGDTHDHSGGDGEQIDHGGLAGLSDADHPESALVLSDNTTNNVSITAHGFAPKLSNSASEYLSGTGVYTVIYPIGMVVLTDTNDNPSTLGVAGTWVAY